MHSAPPILIAGGGIGGLAAALALARIGRASMVLERSTGPSDAGAGIQLGPNAVKALRQLGVADAVSAVASAPEALIVRRGLDGKILARAPLSALALARYGAPYWVVHRADLHRCLADAAAASPLIDLRTSTEVIGVAKTADTVSITLANGQTLSAPALIGADGVWSKVRSLALPGAPSEPSGYVAYRTILPVTSTGILAANEIGAWLSPGAHVVHYPVQSGHGINVVVIVRDAWTDTTWNAPATSGELTRALANFALDLHAAPASAPQWHKWSLAAPLHLNSWVRGRISLLGDAAHPILPFLAQGGALALEDAVQLAASVQASPDDIPLALITYHRARSARTRHVQANAARNGRIFHLSGPLALARDLTLQTLPPRTLLTRLDWLYGHAGPALKTNDEP